jgi:hypothetical protein
MGWTMPPEPPEVLLHYSEDPGIPQFVPHVPRSNPTAAPAVWAIDCARAPLYWFPRDCPRVTVWANDAVQQERLERAFSTSARRVHAAPLAWLEAMRSCHLYEYRFAPEQFVPWPDAEGQWVAHEPVVSTSVEPAGDLLERHAEIGIELRLVPDLAPLRAAVLAAGLPFSIVRYRGEPVERR